MIADTVAPVDMSLNCRLTVQFSKKSLARLLKNVEREVLLAAIDEAGMQAVFRRDEVLAAIAEAHLPNPFVAALISGAASMASRTRGVAERSSFFNPNTLIKWVHFFIVAVFHDLVLTLYGAPTGFGEYILFDFPSFQPVEPTPEEPPPGELPRDIDWDSVNNLLIGATSDVLRIRDHLNMMRAEMAEAEADPTALALHAARHNVAYTSAENVRARALRNLSALDSELKGA